MDLRNSQSSSRHWQTAAAAREAVSSYSELAADVTSSTAPTGPPPPLMTRAARRLAELQCSAPLDSTGVLAEAGSANGVDGLQQTDEDAFESDAANSDAAMDTGHDLDTGAYSALVMLFVVTDRFAV